MTTYVEKALVWTDVETDGLIAHRQHLLEIAVLVTDLDLNILDESGYETAILHTPEESAAMRAAAVPFVQNMHDESGIWQSITDPTKAKPREQVEAELVAYIKNLVPEPRTARCAGNSVRLDLNFLDEFLPSVTAHLHYRMLDVSSHTGPAQWWAGIEPMEKARNHTAMADIRESIAEMRYLKKRTYDRLPKVSA